MRITEVKMKCPVCGWTGKLFDTEPDNEGSPCCPKCMCNVIAVDARLRGES